MTDALHFSLSFYLEVAAPFGVSVKCDSYGVVVEWMATGLSEQADFLLELKADSG